MIQLKIPSWVAAVWGSKNPEGIILEKEFCPGITLGDLLKELVTRQNYLENIVFDRNTTKISTQVMVVLNENLLQILDMDGYKLKEGDTISLLPVYTGG